MPTSSHAEEGRTPNVFVVDDDPSVRESVRRLLVSAGFVVEAFANPKEFLEVFGVREEPSCVVLDVVMPEGNGLALQEQLRSRAIPPAIVFLTGRADVRTSVSAMKNGAVEFLTKPFQPGALLAAVRGALEREQALGDERRSLAELRERHRSLTTRERDVMAGVMEGLINKQIAARFGTSEVTVKEQRAALMRKMCASSAAELVRIGLKLGL